MLSLCGDSQFKFDLKVFQSQSQVDALLRTQKKQIMNVSSNFSSSLPETTPPVIISCAAKAESYSFVIPLYYALTFIGIILICSIVYFIKLKNERNIYVADGAVESYAKEYFKILFKFRSMYGSIFTQLFDQVSDITVINQLWLLAKDERNGNVTCYHMNINYLLTASLFIFISSRIISSILIYRALKDNGDKKQRLLISILQFFDLTFVLTLKVNYKFQNVRPCNPQRYITNIEAVFEAFPQILVQSYFLLSLNLAQNQQSFGGDRVSSSSSNTSSFNNFFKSNLMVILSIYMSFCSILSKKLWQDKELVLPQWQNMFRVRSRHNYYNSTSRNSIAISNINSQPQRPRSTSSNLSSMNNINISALNVYSSQSGHTSASGVDHPVLRSSSTVESLERALSMENDCCISVGICGNRNSKCNHNCCCGSSPVVLNGKYFTRILWRLCTVLHRLCLFLLIWRIIGGEWLIGIWIWEFIFYFCIYYFTNESVFLEAIMAFVLRHISLDHNKKFEYFAILWTRFDSKLLFYNQIFGTIIYSFILSALFGLSAMTGDINCCNGMDVSYFVIEWFIIVVILCCLPYVSVALWCQKSNKAACFVFFLFFFLRILIFFISCVLFNYYVYFGLMFVDLIVIYYNSIKQSGFYFDKTTLDYFVAGYLTVCSPAWMGGNKKPKTNTNKDSNHDDHDNNNNNKIRDYILFSFQSVYSCFYFVCVLFFLFYSKHVNIMFVNTYDDTIYYFLNDSKGDTDSMIVTLISLVGILSIILPIWTYYLLMKSKLVNNNMSNNRDLYTMSASGDIVGIIEFREFGNGIKMTKVNNHNSRSNSIRSSPRVPPKDNHNNNNPNNNKMEGGYSVSINTRMGQYVSRALNSDNFKSNIFPSMPFLKQYQLMRYLFDTYGVRLDSNSQQKLIQRITVSHRIRMFIYKFKNDGIGLYSFFTECFDLPVIHDLLPELCTAAKTYTSADNTNINSMLYNLVVECITDNEILWDSWTKPIDLTSFDFNQIIPVIRQLSLHCYFEDTIIESNFIIDWDNLSEVNQYRLINHCSTLHRQQRLRPSMERALVVFNSLIGIMEVNIDRSQNIYNYTKPTNANNNNNDDYGAVGNNRSDCVRMNDVIPSNLFKQLRQRSGSNANDIEECLDNVVSSLGVEVLVELIDSSCRDDVDNDNGRNGVLFELRDRMVSELTYRLHQASLDDWEQWNINQFLPFNLSFFPFDIIQQIVKSIDCRHVSYNLQDLGLNWIESVFTIDLTKMNQLQICSIMTNFYFQHQLRFHKNTQFSTVNAFDINEFVNQYGDEEEHDSLNGFVNSLSVRVWPFLYHKMQLKRVYKKFIQFTQNTPITTPNWDPPIDISLFTPKMMDKILSITKKRLKKESANTQIRIPTFLFAFDHDAVADNENTKKMASLKNFYDQVYIFVFCIYFVCHVNTFVIVGLC